MLNGAIEEINYLSSNECNNSNAKNDLKGQLFLSAREGNINTLKQLLETKENKFDTQTLVHAFCESVAKKHLSVCAHLLQMDGVSTTLLTDCYGIMFIYRHKDFLSRLNNAGVQKVLASNERIKRVSPFSELAY